MPTDASIIAALDMGTNTFKLSVFRNEGGVIEELANDNRVMRIARLIDSDGMFPDSASQAIVDAVGDLADIGHDLGASEFVGVATQGFRTASNGDTVLARITHETPWQIRLISGAEEAELTFEGLIDYLPEAGSALIVDIGGGSTEIVLATDRQLVASESLHLGSGVLTDRYVRSDPPGEAELAAAGDAAAAAMSFAAIPVPERIDAMVFSGGAGQFLDAIARREIDADKGIARLELLTDIFLQASATDLAEWLGIPVIRAQVIPAGHRIALAAMRRFQPVSITAAPSGIRFGLVRRHMRAN